MGSGYSKMKKQARLMEQQLEMMRNEMKTKQVSGSAGNGLVTVRVSGEKELLEINIKPECVDTSDLEGLQDLIKAACDDAYSKLSDDPTSNFTTLSGRVDSPFGL
jgi:DNA-binding YbaB/EbfC family protein